ncbi:MAG: nitroreductase family protein [Rikenellaceae bacterium]|nr:nitroreductase family protein [Rikenellaceae bacterium]
MDFSELIKIRQSDRSYSDRPVEAAKIEQIVEAGRLAPSSNNSQPWKLVVVDDAALREQVAGCASTLGLNKFVHQAPAIIVVVMEKPNMLSRIGSVVQDKEYPLLDIGILASHICLQAADLGLGTCMVGWFKEDKLRRLLGIGKRTRIPLMITVGYPASPTRPKSRKPTEEICGRNKY